MEGHRGELGKSPLQALQARGAKQPHQIFVNHKSEFDEVR